jgi:hypothetical protein
VLSLTALVFIIAIALCFFLFGLLRLGPFAGLALFFIFPVLFFFAMLIVPLSVVFGIWCIKKRADRYTAVQKLIRTCLLIAVLLLSLSYPFWCARLPVYGVRVCVAITGGVDELQNWAVHILDMPIEEVYDKEEAKHGTYIIRRELYSPQMRKISQGEVYIISYENEEPYLNIVLAGGFFPGWGIRVGRPDFRPPYSGSIWYSKWADGVYGFACH